VLSYKILSDLYSVPHSTIYDKVSRARLN
jgi:hypothetical protein